MSERSLCAFVYGPYDNCFDTGCGGQGGRCEYVGPPGRFACRCIAPSTNCADPRGEVAVEEWLERYQTMVAEQPRCEDSWFGDAMAKCRGGEETAGRRISAGCLWLALQLAQTRANEQTGFSLLDLVQEANAGIVDALHSFTGQTTGEFLKHATQAIEQRFRSLAAAA